MPAWPSLPSKECMMIRTVWLSLVFMLVTPSLRALELVIYNWPYYLAPEVKSLFTQETGITIKVCSRKSFGNFSD